MIIAHSIRPQTNTKRYFKFALLPKRVWRDEDKTESVIVWLEYYTEARTRIYAGGFFAYHQSSFYLTEKLVEGPVNSR
jgi:hypothetical protein